MYAHFQKVKDKAKEAKGEVWAVVYSADKQPDAQGDTISLDELKLAARSFVEAAAPLDVQHGAEEGETGRRYDPWAMYVLGSFVTKSGDWVLQVQIDRETKDGSILWQRIVAGIEGKDEVIIGGKTYPSLTGFSMGGSALAREEVA